MTEMDSSDGSWVRTLSNATYGFDAPTAIAYDGTHLWVANAYGGHVTELNPSDGSLVGEASDPLGNPNAIVFADGHLWLPNYTNNSVTEISASDGTTTQTISGGSYAFNLPLGIAFDGTNLWVTNVSGNSVTELSATDGSWEQTLTN